MRFLFVIFLFFVLISPSYSCITTPITFFWDSQQEKINKKVVRESKKKLKLYEKQIKELREHPHNNMPKLYEDYLRRSAQAPRTQRAINEPAILQDPKLTSIPNPNIRLIKYNDPPGSPDVNVKALKRWKHINSNGMANPAMTKMVYSATYFYPSMTEVTSELYLIDLDQAQNNKQKILRANIVKRDADSIMKTGFDDSEYRALRVLVPLDWSYDGKKIAVKEKIGGVTDGLWKTNLWVYDMETKKAKRLNEVREAIKYYWLKKEHLHLDDYSWDIFPLGWDANNPDRIIVLGFITTKQAPKYLGAWSIDENGVRSKLESLTQLGFEINANGISAKMIIHE